MSSRNRVYERAAKRTVDRTLELAAIPAPTFDEGARARTVAGWWTDAGLDPTIDDVGNVWSRVRKGPGPALLVCAHLDTVFPLDVPHGVRSEEDRLIGPSVGDNTVALAALSELPALLPAECGEVWLLATVAEEGLGNLMGIRHALRHATSEIGSVIAIEGNYLERVVTRAVGSVRWRVAFEGPGGHAWEASDNPSSIHELARIVSALDELPRRPDLLGRCVLNVGTISGGEAINARARHAEMQVDIRSSDPEILGLLEQLAVRRIRSAQGVEVQMTEVGRRPAGSIADSHPLAVSALAALTAVGLHPRLSEASTDANAAHEAGIPAIAIGVTSGEGEHTEHEWISVSPIALGLEAMAETVVNVQEEFDEHP